MSANLNPEQRQAVTAPDGPLCIVAGPGTGKTKTLVERIAYLVSERRVPAQSILALTFTNKAAREMAGRLAVRLQTVPLVFTFHALAARLCPPSDKRLVTDIERTAILVALKKTVGQNGLNIRDLGLAISLAKNHSELQDAKHVHHFRQLYDSELERLGLYDYDDLLLDLYDTLKKPASRLQSAPYQHILVDEFQDTNVLQYEILRLLDTTGNIAVIGDPLQSIYGFRGAYAGMFERFDQDWSDVRHVTLTTNYRSASEIVGLANAIFPEAQQLKAHRTQPGTVEAVEVLNEYSEAEWVVDEIERQTGGSTMIKSSKHHDDDKQRCFDDFAIIYRTHAVAATVRQRLERSGIPYQVAGDGSPYTTPHIAALLQAFAYLADPSIMPQIKDYSPAQVRRLIDTMRPQLTDGDLPGTAEQLIAVLGLENDKTRSSLRQYIGTLVRHKQLSFKGYIKHMQEIADHDYYDPTSGAVTLLTIHASKGLEFDCLFLIGAEEGILPHQREGKPTDLEEEKRLFYVAATRARDELHILHARARKGRQQQLSSFVAGLPKEAIRHRVDPAMTAQQKAATRRAHKKAQSTLF